LRYHFNNAAGVHLCCTSEYKSKAQNPRSSSRYRTVIINVPHWDEATNYKSDAECLLLNMWLNAKTNLEEAMARWHALVVDNNICRFKYEGTTHSKVTFRVHDKYNISNIFRTRIKPRKDIFL